MSRDFDEPPDADDRLDDDVIAAAQERGFKIAVPCQSCGRFLVSAKSIRYRLGPRCRARAAGQQAA
jgi:hypothetical protein